MVVFVSLECEETYDELLSLYNAQKQRSTPPHTHSAGVNPVYKCTSVNQVLSGVLVLIVEETTVLCSIVQYLHVTPERVTYGYCSCCQRLTVTCSSTTAR